MAEQMLSEHFSLAEMIFSDSAVRLGIDNTPSPEIVAALTALCENILEPMREHFGPMRINSGYRSPAVNAHIGGATNSQHCKGEAADIVVPGLAVKEVSLWVMNSALPFDQLIWEFDSWTHCSFTTAQTARNSVLTASKVDGKTVYSEGIA